MLDDFDIRVLKIGDAQTCRVLRVTLALAASALPRPAVTTLIATRALTAFIAALVLLGPPHVLRHNRLLTTLRIGRSHAASHGLIARII